MDYIDPGTILIKLKTKFALQSLFITDAILSILLQIPKIEAFGSGKKL
ncbi:hypothetical protein [Leptospira wolffii]|nr:hypothetical protein [Leptospira wolffii]